MSPKTHDITLTSLDGSNCTVRAADVIGVEPDGGGSAVQMRWSGTVRVREAPDAVKAKVKEAL